MSPLLAGLVALGACGGSAGSTPQECPDLLWPDHHSSPSWDPEAPPAALRICATRLGDVLGAWATPDGLAWNVSSDLGLSWFPVSPPVFDEPGWRGAFALACGEDAALSIAARTGSVEAWEPDSWDGSVELAASWPASAVDVATAETPGGWAVAWAGEAGVFVAEIDGHDVGEPLPIAGAGDAVALVAHGDDLVVAWRNPVRGAIRAARAAEGWTELAVGDAAEPVERIGAWVRGPSVAIRWLTSTDGARTVAGARLEGSVVADAFAWDTPLSIAAVAPATADGDLLCGTSGSDLGCATGAAWGPVDPVPIDIGNDLVDVLSVDVATWDNGIVWVSSVVRVAAGYVLPSVRRGTLAEVVEAQACRADAP